MKSVQNETKTLRELVGLSFRHGRTSGIENFYPWFGMFFHRKPHIIANKYVQDFFRVSISS